MQNQDNSWNVIVEKAMQFNITANDIFSYIHAHVEGCQGIVFKPVSSEKKEGGIYLTGNWGKLGNLTLGPFPETMEGMIDKMFIERDVVKMVKNHPEYVRFAEDKHHLPIDHQMFLKDKGFMLDEKGSIVDILVPR